jgi:hypothetical protein
MSPNVGGWVWGGGGCVFSAVHNAHGAQINFGDLTPHLTDVVCHKVHTCKEYHSVCPLVGIGTLPPPLSPASVPIPPEPGGGTLARG